ncbi:MAG: type II toxin-antitoxin system VapC family toxin [Burkholderiaceae bacterium]
MSEPTSPGSLRRLYVAEPPASYLVRPPLVVDCSMLAAVLFQEIGRDDAHHRLTGRELHVPELLDYEIMSVALKKLRQGRGDLVAVAMPQYDAFPVQLHSVDVATTLELATRYQLSAYDAAYLWLAAELNAPLATFDERLAAAAQRHLSTLP